jgi:hypothetical protein
MHQIFVEKKLTLVGPISDDRSHVFSSLTYYMLLPFAALYNFDPLGSVTGAAVWGVLTWAVMMIFVKRKFPKFLVLTGILGAIWFPLVQTARWPWNPNLIIFWIFLGLILSDYKKWWIRFLAGFSFGLAIHHHYLAIVPAILMVVKKRDLFMFLGTLAAIMPFVIFDLRHPPGLFIFRMIAYNQGTMNTNVPQLIKNIPALFSFFSNYIFQLQPLAMLGTAAIILLAFSDLIKKSSARGWLLIWVITLVPLLMYSLQSQYLLPVLPFFVIWILADRTGLSRKLAKGIICLLIIGSVIGLPPLYNVPDWQGNLKLVRGVTDIIGGQIVKNKMVNPNLAVLSSPDIYTNGKKYRDMLLIRNIRVKAYEEYETSDNLFVITTGTPDELRKDPALEMLFFRKGPVAGVWNVPGSNWKVVQFNKY